MSKFMSFTAAAMKNLFSNPATTEYPAVPREYPERTRGHVEIDIDDCILCGMCMRTCPPGAIQVDRAAGAWSIQRFDCVQCGYCVEKCPKKCLHIVPGYTAPAEDKQAQVVKKPMAVPQDGMAASMGQNCASAAGEGAGTAKAASPSAGVPGGTPRADEEACVYCTLCAQKCPAGAIKVDREQKLWKLDKDACIGCGLCASNCPKKCITLE